MARYRACLPQQDGGLFLTDGGIETTLIFLEGVDLPLFAAFDLLKTNEGTQALRAYYARYTRIAKDAGVGFILESPTWRASRDWGEKLGHTPEAIEDINRRAIGLMADLRDGMDTTAHVVISGCVGPRGDGYRPETMMSAEEAEAYHAHQIGAFAGTEADMVSAMTMTHSGEAIGVVRAAAAVGLPVVISFTLETDGRLPSGQTLKQAIEEVDAATERYVAYYMINCAHPSHFADVLADTGEWVGRIRGLRANASRRSHAELDEATDLDDGDPAELAEEYADLRRLLPNLTVLGGCCGTDHRHVEHISRTCA